MKSWPQDASNEPTSFTNRRAQDALVSGLGEGFGATILAVASSTISRSDVETFAADVTDLAHVKEVTPLGKSPDGKIIVLAITPTIRTADPGTPALVNDIRALAPGGVHITGDSPVNTDIADLLSRRLPLVMAFVIGSACILLGLIFRSVAIPIKAALMNLLSVAAAYGAMQLVFHDGYGRELIGVDKQVPVSSYVLMLMFTILFGLSMDYEVFILSRIKEQFDLTGDPDTSLTRGLANTAGVVTAAATVMVAVFAGFAAEGDIIVKQMGFGMAVAIFLDATLIRMVLVPATMAVLGRWNWWPGVGRDRSKVGGTVAVTGARFADTASTPTASGLPTAPQFTP
jgi:RND superfamily putative drug exporter